MQKISSRSIFLLVVAALVWAGNYAETDNWELSQYDSESGGVAFQARGRGGENVFGGYVLIQKINAGAVTPNRVVFWICPPDAGGICYSGGVIEVGPDRYGGGANWVDPQGQQVSPPKGGEKFVQKVLSSARREWPGWAKEEVRPYLAFLDIKL